MSQPSIAGGRVFVGSETGIVYALDASTGCTRWSFKADGPVRTATSRRRHDAPAPSSTRPRPRGRSCSSAIRTATSTPSTPIRGVFRWKVRADSHEAAIITGAPKFHEGASTCRSLRARKAPAPIPDTPAARSVAASSRSMPSPATASGRRTWSRSRSRRRQARRVIRMFGPSGVAVWSSPIVDVERSAVYVATGDNYSQPASAMSDAAVALDLATGRILWHQQLRPDDMWNLACVGEDRTNCPEDAAGPDYDFGATPVLATVAGTKQRVVLMGQKSSEVYALDPDQRGHGRLEEEARAPAGCWAASSGASQPTTATSTSRSPTSSSSTSRGSRSARSEEGRRTLRAGSRRRAPSAGTRRRRTAAPGRSAAPRSHRRRR